MKNKKYLEYDWRDLITSQKIKKLVVVELNKYLEHHNLSEQGTKEDKIKRITLEATELQLTIRMIEILLCLAKIAPLKTTATLKMKTVMAKIQMKMMKF